MDQQDRPDDSRGWLRKDESKPSPERVRQNSVRLVLALVFALGRMHDQMLKKASRSIDRGGDALEHGRHARDVHAVRNLQCRQLGIADD